MKFVPNVEQVSKGLGYLLLTLVGAVLTVTVLVAVGGAALWGYDYYKARGQDHQVVVLQPLGEGSPYICFVSTKGSQVLGSPDCLDASLTSTPPQE